MRWVLASFLAIIMTLALFVVMMRLVDDRGGKASELVENQNQTVFVKASVPPFRDLIICFGPVDPYTQELLLKPEMSTKGLLLDEAQVALLNSSFAADFDQVQFQIPTLPDADLSYQPWSKSSHDSCGPLKPPTSNYPSALRTLEADCETAFYVDREGKPFNVKAECTEKMFERETEIAVFKMRWRITNEDGEACSYIDQTEYPILYPIAYRLDE
jgi:hypothetical protein